MKAFLALLALAALAAPSVAAGSQCFGTVSKGRLTGAVQMPLSGANYSAYSARAHAAGRTYVHAQVQRSIVNAYDAIARSGSASIYVYGETGFAAGGPFAPHKSHQNGLSVDFFVPVVDANGKPVAPPTSEQTRLGYDIEFDARATYGQYRIDFAAMAEHLYQLQRAALAQNAGIALVIFDPRYLPALFATARGPYLKKNLVFMRKDPWVRHDEHYHVNFAIACKR